MIDFLGKSRIRQAIILLFIYNPKKEYHLSEVARAVGTSPGTAQREVNRLLKNDFILFRKKANLNIYCLNTRFTILEEVRSIVRKTIGIEVDLRRELNRVGGIDYAFLFGSYAKKGLKSDSDIDLYVIGDPQEDKLFRVIQKAEARIGREINYHLAGEEEFFKKRKSNYFLKEITEACLLIVGDGNEFKKHL
jgi:predicted nucleotidyltransferase